MPIERLPPQDLDAEKALLGSMLMSSSRMDLDWTIDDIVAIVPPAAFFVTEHILVYAAICDAHGAGLPMDLIMLAPRLQVQSQREGTYWQDYTIELAESFSDVANGPYYARIVREKWRLRCIMGAAHRAVSACYELDADATDVGEALRRQLDATEAATAADREAVRVSDIMRDVDATSDAEIVPIAPGDLAYRLGGGLQPGTLTVIGARPSCGKTSMGLQWCISAEEAGHSAILLSAEMSNQQIGQRLRMMDTHARSADFYVIDGIRDCTTIAGYIRTYAKRHGCKLAVVDYLGLLDIRGKYDRNDLRIGAITKMLKAVAMDTGTAVVLLCQLNRAADHENRRPRLSDLRDSGLIEADADVVVLLHKSQIEADVVPSDAIVAKNRQGQTGEVTLEYDRRRFVYQNKNFVHAGERGRGLVLAGCSGWNDDAPPF